MERKYAIQGIVGCALFGVGDWLLGFVNTDKVDGDVFYFISAGHGAEYAEWKIIVTLVCAVIGVVFFGQGCTHMADYMKEKEDKVIAERVFSFITYSWLIIHFTVTIMVYTYSYMCRNVGTEQAALMSQEMNKVLSPFLVLGYVILLIAFVYMIIVIARGRTTLNKREVFFTPITWVCLIGLVSMLLPESPFSKGLYTFCMNGGMMVWFVRELFRKVR